MQSNGIHLIAHFDTELPDTELAVRAAGLGVAALSTWTVSRALRPALILGFANIQAEKARLEVERLATALDLRT
jgi:DNA-binding transcriptional MocR family regulator